MLVKKKLLQMPLPEYPKDIKARKDHTIIQSDVKDGIYQLAIWQKKKFIGRSFSDGKNFINYDAEKNSWNQNIIGEHDYIFSETEQSYKQTKEFFGGWSYSSVGIMNNEISSKRREKSAQAAINKYTRMMNRINYIPSDPEDLEEYCEKHVFKKKFALLKKGDKKRTEENCKCLVCGKSFKYKGKLKHKEQIKCPKCDSEVRMVAERYIGTAKEKAEISVLFRNEKNDILMRWEHIEKTFDIQGKAKYAVDPFRWEIHEENGKIHRYHWKSIMGYGYDYREDKYDTYVEANVYDKDLNKVFEGIDTGLDLEKLHLAGPISFKNLIYNGKEFNVTKTLYKIGLYRLASEVNSRFIKNTNTFEGALGINAKYHKIAKELNISLETLRVMQSANIHLTDEVVRKIDYITEKTGYDWLNKIQEMQQYTGFERMINYLYKQKLLRPKTDLSTFAIWYLDYRSMSKELNEQLKEGKKVDASKSAFIMPRDIKVAHDGVSSKLKVLKNKEKERIIRNIGIRLKKRKSFSYKNMMIVYPESIEDFVSEGATLKHCVGNSPAYKNGQADGSLLTVFIRKKKEPNKPYQTATFYPKENYKLKETYGHGHRVANKEIQEFIKVYQEFMRGQAAQQAA